MKTIFCRTILFAMMLIATSGNLLAQDDADGCKDHPMFNRMPNYYLYNCKEVEFGSMKFPVGAPDPQKDNLTKVENIEVKIMVFNYLLKDDKKPASSLQIFRNFQMIRNKTVESSKVNNKDGAQGLMYTEVILAKALSLLEMVAPIGGKLLNSQKTIRKFGYMFRCQVMEKDMIW